MSLTPAGNTLTLVAVNGGLIAAAVFAVIRYAPSLDVRQPCTPTDPRVPDSD
ncbi:hypothetical protein [Kribbella sp. VKM Ac-2568]|uniref:hypothetical protein n=1 Tax=Kribbella sp. VKM Ac-2568 TaxID=2512219 RepID=UPI00130517AB|nr:hypothetical protein [Kribbella sp. VKM Ac-2568]